MTQQPPPPPPPPPAYGRPASGRPGGVTASAVLLIVLGSLYAFFGVLIVAGGGALTDLFGGIGGVIIVLGLVVAAFGVLDIIAGVKVLGLSSGWRIGGIILTSIGGLFALIGTIGSFSSQAEPTFDQETLQVVTESAGPNVSGILFGLLFLAANIVALVLLARNGRVFVR
jgi:amino acid transporter